MITYNQWLDYFLLDEDGEPVNGDDGQPIAIGKEYYFDITISPVSYTHMTLPTKRIV